jgi:lipopolysaccharide transport system permease protein
MALGHSVVHPTIKIESDRGWRATNLRELWNFRELLMLLAWRDIRVRYKQTLLGASWAILQPFLTVLVFSVLFGKFARLPSEGFPYPIFLYAGLLPWIFFQSVATASSNSLVDNAGLITKVYFPRMILPGATVLAGLVDFGIASTIMFGMMAFYGIWPRIGILLLPMLVALLVITAFAAGLWLSALNLKYRDVRHAVPFMMQTWLYLTPVIYPVTLLPPRWRWMLALNPLSGTVEGFRATLLGKRIPWQALGISATVALASVWYAARVFGRLDRDFADIV